MSGAWQVSVIPNAVDSQGFTPNISARPDYRRRINIVIISRLVYRTLSLFQHSSLASIHISRIIDVTRNQIRCSYACCVLVGIPSEPSSAIDPNIRSALWRAISRYCFGAHMHEMMKYFLFTEIHEQCLNQLSVPSWDSSICRRIDRVTIPSESLPLV